MLHGLPDLSRSIPKCDKREDFADPRYPPRESLTLFSGHRSGVSCLSKHLKAVNHANLVHIIGKEGRITLSGVLLHFFRWLSLCQEAVPYLSSKRHRLAQDTPLNFSRKPRSMTTFTFITLQRFKLADIADWLRSMEPGVILQGYRDRSSSPLRL